MSTSYTVTELAVAVLRELNVIDATESPSTSDEDVDYVISTYEAKWEQMTAAGQETTYWQLAVIPSAVFLTLRDLMMLEVQGAFGDPLPPATKEQQEVIILKKLRKHLARRETGGRTYGEYF